MPIIKVFPHGFTKVVGDDKALYSFAAQPVYDGKLEDDETQPSESAIGSTQTKSVYNPVTDKYSDVSYVYPLMNGICYDSKLVCSLNNELLVNAENFEFCMEPPKSLIHADPNVFTLMGPYYFGLTQPAVYNEFLTTQEDYMYGPLPISIVYDHMQVYYIPTDPVKNPKDINNVTSEKSLTFHYKGILSELELLETDDMTEEQTEQEAAEFAEKYKVLCETSNVAGSFVRDNTSKRKFTFTTRAQIGTYRFAIRDNFTKRINPIKTDLYYRTDKSVVVKLWPRTLPVAYQMNTEGALQHVGLWQFGFSPMPKVNYNLRFFDKRQAPNLTQLDLNFPIDPQEALMKIQKVDASVEGDNELDEVEINVHFWRVFYSDTPYIPKTITNGSKTKITIDGTISYPLRWYIIPTDTPQGEKPAVLVPDKDAVDTYNIVGVSTGKFRLVVMDGSFLAYVSSEIEVT